MIFSCISRSVALADPLAEMELVSAQMRDAGMPYVFLYSGGELSPRSDPSGNVQGNRFYQYALIACVISLRQS